MMPERFAKLLVYVAAALSQETDAVQQRVFWAALKDIPLDLLEEVAGRIVHDTLSPDGYPVKIPPPARWRVLADDILLARHRDARITATARLLSGTAEVPDHTEDCQLCEDTGWAPVDPVSGSLMPIATLYQDDGRFLRAHPSVHVRACPCRSTNQSYRLRHTIRRYSKATGRPSR